MLTGIAFQLAVVTGLGGFIGWKIDEHYQIENSIATIFGTFIGFAVAMYGVVKQINKLSK